MRFLILLGIALLALACFGIAMAVAHEAPSGWNYPAFCCHNRDCRRINPEDVAAVPQGWGVRATGEVIDYEKTRESPDGEFHRCSPAFASDTAEDTTLCLFAPKHLF